MQLTAHHTKLHQGEGEEQGRRGVGLGSEG
jgi:hypothetical protein